MHNTFYARGFLFHLPSQQILLQQEQSPSLGSSWVLFEIQHTENEKPEDIFKNTLFKTLSIKKHTSLNKIYSYTRDNLKNYTLFYITVDKLEEFAPVNDYIFRWFSFKEILKIKANEQTKHDIVVGQRVIDALKRDNDANLQKLIEEASNE